MKKIWLICGLSLGFCLILFLLPKREAIFAGKTVGGSRRCIVIDSGHGGIDPGVVGVHGIQEKDINLKIAKQLQKELEKAGYQTFLTREQDEGLYEPDSRNKKVQDMQRRCALIKEKNPLLTVSIHQNSYPDPSVCGPQVFYYTSSEKGRVLARCIQEELNTRLVVKRPRVEKADSSYYLLKSSEGLLNIVETGFLTNEEEAELLCTETYQRECAKAICSGILKFLKTVEKNGKNML